MQGYHATEHTWSVSSPGPRQAERLEARSLVLNLLILGGPWPFLGYDSGYVEFLSEHSFLSSLRSDSPVLLWAFGSGAPQAGELPLSCPAAARLCVSRRTLGGRAGPRDGQVDPALSAGSGEPRNGIPALARCSLVCFLYTSSSLFPAAGLVDMPSSSFGGNGSFRNFPSPDSPSEI